MQASIERQGNAFLNKIFTPDEKKYCASKRMKYEHYAARFAAKEAAMKAFNIRGENRFRFKDIQIKRQATGKPQIYLTPAARKRFKIPPKSQIELSMSHERDYAVATVVMLTP